MKLQHVPLIRTTMAPQFTVNPVQQTQAIVSPEAGVYLIVSVSKDMKAVQRVVTPVQVRKTFFFAPSTRYFSDVFENGSFLSVSISLLSTRKRRFRAPETLVFISYPQRGDFWKRRLLGFSLYLRTDENRHTSYTTSIKHTLKGMLSYKSVILAFSCGRAKKLDI